jgi:SAM-dependent methyltransferase
MLWFRRKYNIHPENCTLLTSVRYVEEISISKNILAQIGDHLNVIVSAKRLGNREAQANIVALDPTTSQPVALLDGFKFVAINSTDSSIGQTHLGPKHCYKPVWEPDVELIARPELDQVLQAAPRPDDRPKTVRELELLAYYFIDSTLQAVDEKEINSMLPHHQLFYKDLCRLRQDVIAKTHPQQTGEWQQLQSTHVRSKLQALTEYYRNHETAYDGKLLVRVGEALPAVFRQEVEPLALMTHENLLEDYYTTAVGMPNTYAQITRYVSMLSHKYPNLDFLEIGAGTGGATVPTTQGLRGGEGRQVRLKSYTYTDISSYFFERAAEKFGDFAQFLNFRKLDVENDPESQDFKPASYDVIVAANVLHATSDMHRTMTHVRKLLRPGGKLILLEMTNRLLAASVIFGTLPGWWNATDGRTGGPLLTETQWQDVLHETGFGTLQASSPDVLDPLEEGTRLIIIEAVEPKISLRNGMLTPPESTQVIIVCADSPIKMTRSGEAVALLKKMQHSGVDAQLLPFSMLQKRDITDVICISFVELDEPLLASLSPDNMETLQRIADASAGLLWVTRGAASTVVDRPELAVFQGLARSLRAEHGSFRCVTVDLDNQHHTSTSDIADLLFRIHEEHLAPEKILELADSEFVERRGVLHIKRAIEDIESNSFLIARTDLAALPSRRERWVQENRQLRLKITKSESNGPHVWEDNHAISRSLKRSEIEIRVLASNINATDINIVNGSITGHRPGQECAGVVTRTGIHVEHLSVGDRVLAWSPDTFSTHVRRVCR